MRSVPYWLISPALETLRELSVLAIGFTEIQALLCLAAKLVGTIKKSGATQGEQLLLHGCLDFLICGGAAGLNFSLLPIALAGFVSTDGRTLVGADRGSNAVTLQEICVG